MENGGRLEALIVQIHEFSFSASILLEILEIHSMHTCWWELQCMLRMEEAMNS